jgi:hypothetical protein
MRIAHERVYRVYVERTPGRLFVHVPDLPWLAIEADEHAIFAAWRRYEETQGQGFAWELDLAAETLTRRILLPD